MAVQPASVPPRFSERRPSAVYGGREERRLRWSGAEYGLPGVVRPMPARGEVYKHCPDGGVDRGTRRASPCLLRGTVRNPVMRSTSRHVRHICSDHRSPVYRLTVKCGRYSGGRAPRIASSSISVR
jgi:hypothetical protein